MRHIQMQMARNRLAPTTEWTSAADRLWLRHKEVAATQAADRQTYIARHGRRTWSPIKKSLTGLLGNKCWYTEAELVGAHLTVDHFRPVALYWWLAFDSENYRIACPFANSPQHNPEHGCAGGKGDKFPLLPGNLRAKGRNRLKHERPVLLDPCRKEDCELVAFQADGRPILNPGRSADPVARQRLEQSLLLLNLDHPAFNSKREQLYHQIGHAVRTYEELSEGSPSRVGILDRLRARLNSNAPFSSAAGYYMRLHRHLPWVEDLLAACSLLGGRPEQQGV